MLQLSVSDPVQQADGLNKFTSYKVNTNTDLPQFAYSNYAVIRRYSDFLWLATQLASEFAGAIIPPLPEKQAVSRFNSEFVEHRRTQLEKFLQRVAVHPELMGAVSFANFLQADDITFTSMKNAGSSSSTSDGKPPKSTGAGVMKWFAETKTSITHTMGKEDLVKSAFDDQIDEITTYVANLENQMKNVVQHTSGLVKKGKETANGLFEVSENTRDESRKIATAGYIHYRTNPLNSYSFVSLHSFRSCFIKNDFARRSLGWPSRCLDRPSRTSWGRL